MILPAISENLTFNLAVNLSFQILFNISTCSEELLFLFNIISKYRDL
ncbi:hypothetical protein HOG21_03960 [bacterium]|nr:hypothetical protein [bacterium]